MIQKPREFLLKYIAEQFSIPSLTLNTSLFSEQRLDSMALVEIVRFIEESFRIRIKPLEIIYENLDTIEKMAQFIGKKRMRQYGSETTSSYRLSEVAP